jgi:DUF1365 family protein
MKFINTYEERHAYVLPVGEETRPARHGCPKSFYVSPFLSHDCRYQFRIRLPAMTSRSPSTKKKPGDPFSMPALPVSGGR